ncbi:hypothetical protein C8R48DRAFT_762837 [Suillus tomentosus]|nr:hypothetical protein C8R48DRAFT_762837 [Suillus tomentosus]
MAEIVDAKATATARTVAEKKRIFLQILPAKVWAWNYWTFASPTNCRLGTKSARHLGVIVIASQGLLGNGCRTTEYWRRSPVDPAYHATRIHPPGQSIAGPFEGPLKFLRGRASMTRVDHPTRGTRGLPASARSSTVRAKKVWVSHVPKLILIDTNIPHVWNAVNPSYRQKSFLSI